MEPVLGCPHLPRHASEQKRLMHVLILQLSSSSLPCACSAVRQDVSVVVAATCRYMLGRVRELLGSDDDVQPCYSRAVALALQTPVMPYKALPLPL